MIDRTGFDSDEDEDSCGNRGLPIVNPMVSKATDDSSTSSIAATVGSFRRTRRSTVTVDSDED